MYALPLSDDLTCYLSKIAKSSSSFTHLHIWNLAITVLEDVLAPNGACTSANTVLLTQVWQVFFLSHQLFQIIFCSSDVFIENSQCDYQLFQHSEYRQWSIYSWILHYDNTSFIPPMDISCNLNSIMF